MRRAALTICLLLFAVAIGAAACGWHRLSQPWQGYDDEVVVEIPPGLGTRAIVEELAQTGVLRDRQLALAWLFFSPYRGRLQAGEYVFDRPLTTPEVFSRLAEGRVRLYTLTIPEGLRVDQVADRWAEAGFGESQEFLDAAEAALPLAREINPEAPSVEGYLFPETYSFPRGTAAVTAVQTMIRAFGEAVARLEQEVPRSDWPLDLEGTLILASMVESEVAVADERALVASVFTNRLERDMLLECDPTVVYALLRDGSYRGRLLRADLAFDSPYNTYRYPGLPPGAISNPGFDSLRAAVRPAETDYIFFVRTEGGRHTFSRTLAEHNQAVAAYRRMMNE